MALNQYANADLNPADLTDAEKQQLALAGLGATPAQPIAGPEELPGDRNMPMPAPIVAPAGAPPTDQPASPAPPQDETDKLLAAEGHPGVTAAEGDAALLAAKPDEEALPTNTPGVPSVADFVPTQPSDQAAGVPEKPAGARQKVTQVVESPGMVAVNKDADRIAAIKIDEERKAQLVRTAQVAESEKLQAEQTKLAIEKQRKTQEILKDHEDRLATAYTRNQTALEDYRKEAETKRDFWGDKTTGDRMLAGLGLILGGLGAGLTHSENDSVGILNNRINRFYEQQKEKIDQKFKFYEATSKDIDRAKEMRDEEIKNLDLKTGAGVDVLASQLAEMKTKQGATEQSLQSDKDIAGILEKANEFKRKGFEQTKTTVEWDTFNKARAAGGGGGQPGALSKLHEFARLNPGPENEHKVVAEAERLFPGQKPAALQGLVAGAVKANADAKASGSAFDSKMAIRDPNQVDPETGRKGLVIGYAPSARVVQQWNTRAVNYDQAIASLESLKTEGKWIPKGAKWDNAVLAIASTTTAGATDANVRHEAGTLKNMVGLISGDAVNEKIADLQRRKAEFEAQLTPPPPAGERAPAKASPPGTAQTSAAKPAPSRQDKAAAASRVMSDPNAPPAARKRAKEFLQSLAP